MKNFFSSLKNRISLNTFKKYYKINTWLSTDAFFFLIEISSKIFSYLFTKVFDNLLICLCLFSHSDIILICLTFTLNLDHYYYLVSMMHKCTDTKISFLQKLWIDT